MSLSLVGFNSWRLHSQQPVADCFPPSPKQQRCRLVYFCPAGFHSLCISCVLLLLLMGLGAQLGSVFDLLLPLAMCAIALSFLLSIYLYIRSFWAASHGLALGGNTGEDVHLGHKNTPSVGFFLPFSEGSGYSSVYSSKLKLSTSLQAVSATLLYKVTPLQQFEWFLLNVEAESWEQALVALSLCVKKKISEGFSDMVQVRFETWIKLKLNLMTCS